MASNIRIRKVPGRWVVRNDGAVLAETSNALELEEGTRATTIFFPQDDVAMAFLDIEGTDARPFGETTRFSLVAASSTTANVAWALSTPTEEMERLAGHIAFDIHKVTVERL